MENGVLQPQVMHLLTTRIYSVRGRALTQTLWPDAMLDGLTGPGKYPVMMEAEEMLGVSDKCSDVAICTLT